LHSLTWPTKFLVEIESYWETLSDEVGWRMGPSEPVGGVSSVGFLLEFDTRNNILRVTLEGCVTDAILLDAYETAARYVASHTPCRGIGDISRATKFEVSTSTVRKMALSSPVIPAGYTRVFVAPQDSIYGMVRMFQTLGESTRPDFHVVRTMEEAYRLLRVESPEFSPVSVE
jgi:hypothetical protein